MLEVKFYDQIEDELLEFAVIISKTNGKWVFCKHKERDTYEVPGGHREVGEDILETARRELKEETGAIDFSIKPVCAYSVKGKNKFNKRRSNKNTDRHSGNTCFGPVNFGFSCRRYKNFYRCRTFTFF